MSVSARDLNWQYNASVNNQRDSNITDDMDSWMTITLNYFCDCIAKRKKKQYTNVIYTFLF